jgi:pyrroline-5-carboxylate reductase
MSIAPTWLFIGGGNMAQAIIRGSLESGRAEAAQFAVVEPSPVSRAALDALGVRSLESAADAMSWLTTRDSAMSRGGLVLAVKPQSLGEVSATWMPLLCGDAERRNATRLVVSILAGTPRAKVHASLGRCVRVVRAMPNLPARISQSTTALCWGDDARPEDGEDATTLLRAIGPVVERIDETLMDAFTAVAGSGPAYVMVLAEAMMEAAVAIGFEPQIASSIVQQTLLGSALLLTQSPEPPQSIRAAVTSKGGTTAAAVATLENANVRSAFVHAIAAARDRGRELASLA